MTTTVIKYSGDISVCFGDRTLGFGSHFCNLLDVQSGEERLTFNVLLFVSINDNDKDDASWFVLFTVLVNRYELHTAIVRR